MGTWVRLPQDKLVNLDQIELVRVGINGTVEFYGASDTPTCTVDFRDEKGAKSFFEKIGEVLTQLNQL